jgi:hypothetical protein
MMMSKRTTYTMKYKDGEEILTPIEYHINSLIFSILDKNEPVYKRYSITNYYVNGGFTTDSVNEAIEAILQDITFNGKIPLEDRHIRLNRAARKIRQVVNDIYNEVGIKNARHQLTFSAEELFEIQFNPKLIDAIEECREKETEESIENVYDVLHNITMSKELENNRLAVAYRTGGVSSRQYKQCLGVRGFAANLFSRIYKKPITSNYTLGYRTTYEYAADSVSAAVAMFYSTNAIQDSESFSKELRTTASRIKHLVYEDCGTTDTVKVTIREDNSEVNGEILDSDLKDFKGIYYKLNPNDKDWLVIDGTEKHLKGKDIYIRLAYKCRHKSDTVCMRCLGLQGLNTIIGDNIGVVIISILTDIMNQLVLSTKHYISSAKTDEIKFDEFHKQYLAVKGLDIKIRKGDVVKGGVGYGNKGSLKLLLSEFFGLKDISKEHIDSIVPNRVSKISKIWIDRNDGSDPVELHIQQGDKKGELTIPFIRYILDSNYKISDDHMFISIPLQDWSATKPIMSIPNSTFDYRLFGKAVRSLISGGSIDGDISNISADEMFIKLHELISRKVSINVSVLGILVKSLMCNDPDNRDYRLPIEYGRYKLSSPERINKYSSLGTLLTLGYSASLPLADPHNPHNKMDSIYDAIIRPDQVLNDR